MDKKEEKEVEKDSHVPNENKDIDTHFHPDGTDSFEAPSKVNVEGNN